MRRKTVFRAVMVVALLGGVLTALFFLLRHEPRFYRDKEVQEGALRKQQSADCEGKLFSLVTEILNESENWQAVFTEAQINSYLQERFIQSGVANALPVKWISSPRIAIDNDIIHLGFRYGEMEQPWSTIISVDLKVWKTPNEQNVVAVQLLGVKAGWIPLSSKLLMDQLTTLVQSQNKDIEVSWYRHEGYLVALLRFGASRQRQTNQLEQLSVGQGKLIISGHPTSATSHSEPTTQK